MPKLGHSCITSCIELPITRLPYKKRKKCKSSYVHSVLCRLRCFFYHMTCLKCQDFDKVIIRRQKFPMPTYLYEKT